MLGSFIRSFSCVQRLAKSTPTELMQEFLIEWWPTHLNASHPVGPSSIAEMRLVVQAQTANDQTAIYNAFKQLSAADKATLGEEMARSGCAAAPGSRYTLAPIEGGPAFLVYYSPAFLRNLARDAALGALRILAIVYRHARKLWPASEAHEGKGVTIYVDALKACADMKAVVESYMRGEFWVLVMKSETEGAVEKRALSEMPASKDADWSEWAKLGFEVLPLWGVTSERDQEVAETKNPKKQA